jgi:hypothetical protein
VESGYADAMGGGAPEAAQADLALLLGNIDLASLWVTRLHGELSRQALATDLKIGLSPTQAAVLSGLFVTRLKGTMPVCPVYPPCDPGVQAGTDSGVGGGNGAAPGSSGGCSMGRGGASISTFGVLSVLAALALRRRRQGR